MTLERTHTRAAPRRCARDSSLARRARSDARDVARERKMMGKTETFRTRVSSRIEGRGGGAGAATRSTTGNHPIPVYFASVVRSRVARGRTRFSLRTYLEDRST